MPRLDRHAQLTVTLLGVVFCLVGVIVPALRLAMTIEPGQVRDCVRYYDHGNVAAVRFVDGRHYSFGRKDLPDPVQCLPAGAVVQKRPAEILLRINGSPVNAHYSLGVFLMITAAGIGLIALGWRLRPRIHSE